MIEEFLENFEEFKEIFDHIGRLKLCWDKEDEILGLDSEGFRLKVKGVSIEFQNLSKLIDQNNKTISDLDCRVIHNQEYLNSMKTVLSAKIGQLTSLKNDAKTCAPEIIEHLQSGIQFLMEFLKSIQGSKVCSEKTHDYRMASKEFFTNIEINFGPVNLRIQKIYDDLNNISVASDKIQVYDEIYGILTQCRCPAE
jgi:hypothetical protein